MFISKFAKVWNGLDQKKRKSLLDDAGHSKSMSTRCFEYLTYYTRLDVEYAAQRAGVMK